VCVCVCVCVCVSLYTRARRVYIYIDIDININININTHRRTHRHRHRHRHTHTAKLYIKYKESRTKGKRSWLPSDILLLLWHLPARSREVTEVLRSSAAASAFPPSAPMLLTTQTVRKEGRRQYSQTSSWGGLHLKRRLYTEDTHTHTYILRLIKARGMCAWVGGGYIRCYDSKKKNTTH
jgi:hypothetical protein